MPASTGDDVLDGMLDGGFPDERSTLLVGGPGTGKSTLGMQFLQAGLERGEDCLFVSTEQTPGELRGSFEGFPFDLDHENLVVTTLHAVADRTLEGDDELTVKTLDGGELVDTGFGIPFERQYLRQALEQYGPVDRVVLDSASGIAAISDEEARFRRAVLDLIRLFSDDFGATSVVVAEGRPGDPDVIEGHEFLQFATHGAIRLWRGRKHGETYRYLRVEKMRGVDHDTRQYVADISSDGLRVVPRRRTRPRGLANEPARSTGFDGLDDLLGGGLPRGRNTLVLHDGRADVNLFLSRLIAASIRDEWLTSFVLPAELSPATVDEFWSGEPFTVQNALDDGRLQLLEYVRSPSDSHENVLVFDEYDDVSAYLREIAQRSRGRKHLAVVDLEPVLQRLTPDRIKAAAYNFNAELMDEDDVTVYVLNPNTVEDTFTSFFVDVSGTVIRLQQDDDGLEYLHLEKSLAGFSGRGNVVEYLDDPPYLRLG